MRSTNSSTSASDSSTSFAIPTSLSVPSQRIAAGSSIVRAIEAAVSPSMLIVVTYCSTATS